MDLKERMQEVIARMAKGEPGLHTKTIDRFKLVRTTTLPALLKVALRADVKAGKLKKAKVIKRGNHTICILERPE